MLFRSPRERIPELDRSAHLLYSADLNAACPKSVIEALACGLPVVAFDTGALPELVQGANFRRSQSAIVEFELVDRAGEGGCWIDDISADDQRIGRGIDRARLGHARHLNAIDIDAHHRAVIRRRHMLPHTGGQDIGGREDLFWRAADPNDPGQALIRAKRRVSRFERKSADVPGGSLL